MTDPLINSILAQLLITKLQKGDAKDAISMSDFTFNDPWLF